MVSRVQEHVLYQHYTGYVIFVSELVYQIEKGINEVNYYRVDNGRFYTKNMTDFLSPIDSTMKGNKTGQTETFVRIVPKPITVKSFTTEDLYHELKKRKDNPYLDIVLTQSDNVVKECFYLTRTREITYFTGTTYEIKEMAPKVLQEFSSEQEALKAHLLTSYPTRIIKSFYSDVTNRLVKEHTLQGS